MIWRMYFKKLGGHVHCKLFSGPHEGALGQNGSLVFREEEFTEFTGVQRSLPIDFRLDRSEPLGSGDFKFARGVNWS